MANDETLAALERAAMSSLQSGDRPIVDYATVCAALARIQSDAAIIKAKEAEAAQLRTALDDLLSWFPARKPEPECRGGE